MQFSLKILCIALLFMAATSVWSGVIILNDRTTHYGEITPVGEDGYSITSPDGKKSTFRAQDIQRIIDADANTTWMNRPALPKTWKRAEGGLASHSWIGLEVSENGLSGLGLYFEQYIGAGFAPVLAAGVAPWGTRLGTGLMYYLTTDKKYGFYPAVSLGYSHTDGQTITVQGSNANTVVATSSVDMVHLSAVVFLEKFDRAFRFFIQLGYAQTLGGQPSYRRISGGINDKKRRQLNILRPGGLMMSLGGVFAF